MAIVKNELVGINNVLTIVFTTFYCCLLCLNHHKGVTGVLPIVGVYSNWMVWVCKASTFTHRLEIPLGRTGLLLKLLSLVLQFLRCFPIQGSVYSSFTLFEDQALKLLWGSNVVLSCSGLGPRFLAS